MPTAPSRTTSSQVSNERRRLGRHRVDCPAPRRMARLRACLRRHRTSSASARWTQPATGARGWRRRARAGCHPVDDRSTRRRTHKGSWSRHRELERLRVDTERSRAASGATGRDDLHRALGRVRQPEEPAPGQGQGLRRWRLRSGRSTCGPARRRAGSVLLHRVLPDTAARTRIALMVVGGGTYPLVRLDAFVVGR